MDNQGLVPEDFKELLDFLKKFPRTSSKEYRRVIQEHGEAFVMDKRFSQKPMKKLLSSGSSGTPVNILRTNSEYQRIHGSNTIYTFILAGVRPWHKIMAMLPPWDIKKRHHYLQNFGIFRRCDANFLEDADTILDRISDKGINVLFGRVSVMQMLAERCIEVGREMPPMEVILPGAELISSDSRRLLCEVFKPRLYREIYGSTETGIIALRKGGGDYEVNFRSVFLALSTPQTVSQITTGEIAITSLHAVSAPILMLELGDVVSCRNYDEILGLKTSITNISGRISECVWGLSGEKISASDFYSWFTTEPIIRQFRIVQNTVSKCDIFIHLAEHSTEDKTKLEATLRGYLDGKIIATFHYVDHIPFDENGKTKIVVNRIGSS